MAITSSAPSNQAPTPSAIASTAGVPPISTSRCWLGICSAADHPDVFRRRPVDSTRLDRCNHSRQVGGGQIDREARSQRLAPAGMSGLSFRHRVARQPPDLVRKQAARNLTMSNPLYLPETPSQTAGPYVHIGLIPNQAGFDIFATNFSGDIAGPDVAGERIVIEGRIFDASG